MSTETFESETLCHLVEFQLKTFTFKILRINFIKFRYRIKIGYTILVARTNFK